MFKDRQDAGIKLSLALKNYKSDLVIGLPRGGVVLAAEVAKSLHLPLDIVCPRKIGAPHNQEFAIGAITETGEGYLNHEIIQALAISPDYISHEVEEQKTEAIRRLKIFRRSRPPLRIKGKEIILIDDGLATGLTMKAAIKALRQMAPSKIVVAVPVAPSETAEEIKALTDDFICLNISDNFYAVGQFYFDFPQTTDSEVIKLLDSVI